MRKIILTLVLLLFCGLLDANAQDYPVRAVRLIVPFPPGGGADFVARLIQNRFAETLGQQVIVDNRAGASGILGTEIASKASADGYTLAMGTSNTMSANVALFPKLPYDPLRDFAPISLIANQPNILAVHASLPVRSVKELIALAKSRPGQLNYASSGSGSSHHLSGELLKLMSGTNLVHIPYKGTGPAIQETLGGHVEVLFAGIAAVLPHVKSGRLRALGVTTATRSQILPDLPAIAEALPGYELSSWHGMFAPAGTPQAIIAKVHGAVANALKSVDVRERLATQGADALGSTPAHFREFLRADIEKIGKLIRAAGIKAD